MSETLTVDVLNADGKKAGTADLPAEVFDVQTNVPLIHRPGSTVASASIDRPPLQERKRLMVVDDEPAVLRLVTRILANDNYDLASAESGEAALRLMDQPGFAGIDLLVTDLMMPGMNGRELAAVVRQRNAAVQLDIIVLKVNKDRV